MRILMAHCILQQFVYCQESNTLNECSLFFGGHQFNCSISTLDTVAQLQSHLLAYQYEGLIEKSRLGRKNKRQGRFKR